MANVLFDQFKAILVQALSDSDFRRNNKIFQDDDFLADMTARVDALTSDISVRLDYSDVVSALGMVKTNPAQRVIQFDPQGFRTTLSAFREGIIDAPGLLFRRDPDADGIRYLLADQTNGVYYLNDSLEVVRRAPNYGYSVSTQYETPTEAITFTVGATEYVAICSTTHDMVQVYLYDAPYTLIATIGTPDTPGATGSLLSTPVALAFDNTNSLLFVACQDGQPAGATAANGFISIFDLTTPAAPSAVAISHYYGGTGNLLDGQVNKPTDVYFDDADGLLWVVNGNGTNEVGAYTIDTATPAYTLTKYIEAGGPSDSPAGSYALHTPEQVFIHDLLAGYRRIYISNGAAGTVEEFDQTTLRHMATYGYRASEDDLNTYSRFSDTVYGAIGYAKGVTADRVVFGTQEADVLLVSDTLNKRIHQFNLNAYTTDNYANFSTLTFDVPVSVNGWTVAGDIDTDMVKVLYRISETDGDFRELPPETVIPASSTLQFRVAVELDTRRMVRSWNIAYLRINGTQA